MQNIKRQLISGNLVSRRQIQKHILNKKKSHITYKKLQARNGQDDKDEDKGDEKKKEKISFGEELYDYMMGGPKLRMWYGADPDDIIRMKNPKEEIQEEPVEQQDKLAVLVTDGDSQIGQAIILQLILARQRVKCLCRDPVIKRKEFGPYVKALRGSLNDDQSIQKAIQDTRAVVCVGPTGNLIQYINTNLSRIQLDHFVLLHLVDRDSGSQNFFQNFFSSNKELSNLERIHALQNTNIPYSILVFPSKIIDKVQQINQKFKLTTVQYSQDGSTLNTQLDDQQLNQADKITLEDLALIASQVSAMKPIRSKNQNIIKVAEDADGLVPEDLPQSIENDLQYQLQV